MEFQPPGRLRFRRRKISRLAEFDKWEHFWCTSSTASRLRISSIDVSRKFELHVLILKIFDILEDNPIFFRIHFLTFINHNNFKFQPFIIIDPKTEPVWEFYTVRSIYSRSREKRSDLGHPLAPCQRVDALWLSLPLAAAHLLLARVLALLASLSPDSSRSLAECRRLATFVELKSIRLSRLKI